MFSETPLSKNSFSHSTDKKNTEEEDIGEYRLFQKCPFLLPVCTEKIFFEGSSAARLLASNSIQIKLLSGSDGSFWEILATSQVLQPHRRLSPRAAPRSRAPQRCKYSTSPAESRAIQRIQGIRSPNRREPMIMATASLGVKGNHIAQSANQRFHRTVAQHHVRLPLPRDKPAVQALAIGASGTQQMRRSNQK